MWALIENGEVSKILRQELNVDVQGTVIGNIATLPKKERKDLGIYKVIEAVEVDSRYYAATYMRYKIDHKRGEVRQLNEIQPQPIERIARFRLEELKETRDQWLKGSVVSSVSRITSDGERVENLALEFNITPDLISRLALSVPRLGKEGSSNRFHVEDIGGEMQTLRALEFERLARHVSLHIENTYFVYATIRKIIQEWNEDDADSLIEFDIQEDYDKRLKEAMSLSY